MTEQVAFRGWQHCRRVSNGTVDVIVTTDVGPRIVRYGFEGKENVLCEVRDEDGLTGGDTWHTFGGHRLWHSPEANPRTYQPDNVPVPCEDGDRTIVLKPSIEAATGIQKEMKVSLDATGTGVTVMHRLINRGLWPVRLGVWAITVMAPGGVEVIPQTRVDTGLLPNRSIALWSYARMDDPRVHWGDRFVVLHQDPAIKSPYKLGLTDEAGWAAYFNKHSVFMKRFAFVPREEYPDFGVNYESYTTDFMLEMETLSPLHTLQPGETMEHAESWLLVPDVSYPGDSEEDISAVLRDCCHSTALQAGEVL
ncbi:MAG: DUF4380 domain-containing protein [Caldiserica bacterium]|nr:DUF4380 domain-containing protein [Caldisericota bacterium]